MLSRKTLAPCIFGLFVGLVVSPVMWLTYYDPLLQSIGPLCDNIARQSSRSLGETPTLAGNVLGSWSKKVEKFTLNLTADKDIGKKFNLSYANYSVTPSGDTKLRYKRLANEVALRKLLFIGVVTAQKYLDTRATAINNTWGKGYPDLRYFSSHPKNLSVNLPIISLPGVNDSVYPPQRKVYHMLKYMHDHYIDEYDFFMRSDDDIYIKTDLLHDLLLRVNPAQDIYMGCPGFGRPDDRTRIKLNEEEHYCMGGPGVIFSRSALRKLGPHLDACLEVSLQCCRFKFQLLLFLSWNVVIAIKLLT